MALSSMRTQARVMNIPTAPTAINALSTMCPSMTTITNRAHLLRRRAEVFGVELESDGAGEDYEHAETMLRIANSSCERMYIKHNGSLDNSLELVTHPMASSEYLHRFPWEALCKKTAALGYLSRRATTCGLHSYVSRRAFVGGRLAAGRCHCPDFLLL